MKISKRTKRLINFFQLAIISLGFAGSTVISSAQPIVYADEASSSSQSSSSSSNSSSKSDSDVPSEIKKMVETLGEKNNLLNPSFPNSIISTAFKSDGNLSYDPKVQMLITYATLSGSYPSSYKDLYKTGSSISNEFNKQLPGAKTEKMGTDEFVKKLSDAAGSEGGGKSKDDQGNKGPSKADEIATSTFPTDMNKDKLQQWKGASDINKQTYELFKSLTDKLANNGISAVQVKQNNDWPVIATNATDKNGNNGKNVATQLKNVWGSALTGTRNLFASMTGGEKKDAENTYDWFAAASKGSKQEPYTAGDSDASKLYGKNSNVQSKKDDVSNAMIVALMKDVSSLEKINSKSDLEKYLSSQTAKTLYKKGGAKDNWTTVLPNSVKAQMSDGNNGTYNDKMVLFKLGVQKSTVDKMKDFASKNINFISPDQVGSDLKLDNLGKWGQNYQKEINSKHKITVTDAQWKAFQKLQKQTKEQEKTVKSASGVKVLSWSPAIPYSKKATNVSNGALPGYDVKSGQLMKNSTDLGYLTSKMFVTDKNPLNNKYEPWQLDLGGTPDSVITDGESINQLISSDGKSSKNPITKMISSSITSEKLSNNIYGLDAYGNIIDGQTMKVIVPYWQNTSIKSIQELDEKTPFVSTNMGVKQGTFPKNNGEGQVSNQEIEALDKDDAKTIEKVRDAVKGTTTRPKFIAAANKAVGQTGSSTLDKKAAACLSVIITAGTQKQVGAYNKDYLAKVQKSKQCYIGEEININKKNNAKDQQKGTGLYTAADAIQRFGLMTDIGLANELRKTIAGFLVSSYNTDFMQSGSQNIFASDVYGTNNPLASLGAEPYFWVMILISIVLGIITTWQYYRGLVGKGAFVTRFLKALLVIITFGLIGAGVIPQIEETILNWPIKVTTNKIVKRESVIDMWSKLRQQKQVNNVFYEDLMQDNFGGINRTTEYLIPFYTSTRQDGSIDVSASDPTDKNQAIAKDYKQNGKSSDPLNDNNDMIDSAIYRQGNGKVPPMTPYRYKKVYVTLADLTDWASHMTRQKLSAENKPGFQQGDPDYEAPASGYAPGKEPLFDWLAHDYQPVQTGDSSSSNDSDSSSSSSSSSSSTSADADEIQPLTNGNIFTALADDKEGKRDKIIQLAQSRVDKKVPYVYGGNDWDKALDCSGFVQHVYEKAGIDLPRNSAAQYKWALSHGGKEISIDKAKPGDLIFSPKGSGSAHVQIYAGNNMIYEEPAPGQTARKFKEWMQPGQYSVVDMSAQIGSGGGTSSDSSSQSSQSSQQNSSSSQDAQTGGMGDYGTKRNPADTSPKSEYKSDKNSNTIDNSEMYKNLGNYAEFAVNTKHYASKSAAKYGIDQDSEGGQLTASQAFLALWQSAFYNSGEGKDPGDAESFTALMNFADAMNKNQSKDNQKTSDEVGDPDYNGVGEGTVGSVGRNSLINELSMTKYQRQQLNGGNGGYSNAAKQMIDAFKIPAGSSDYFNLDKKGSIIDLMDPDQKVDGRARDAIIFKVNKKVLNDYVTIYSPVRRDINPSNANSSDDSGNDQTDHAGVDPFTMAEDQVVAADMFFTVNQVLDYKMFPTGYDPHSISLDSWNRMLFIPISMMKQLDDNAQYDLDNRTDVSKIALQDNVVEYIALNSSIPALIAFIIMNMLLTLFGWIMKLFFVYFFPLFLIGTFIRWFVSSKGSFKGIFTGSMFAIFIFSAMKFGLGFLFSTLSERLNNDYATNGGATEMHVLAYSLIIIVYMAFCFWLIIQYINFIKGHFWTLGVDPEKGAFKGFGDTVSRSRLNPARSIRERRRNRMSGRWAGKDKEKYHRNSIASRTSANSNDIKRRSNYGGSKMNHVLRTINDSKAKSFVSKGRRFYKNGKDNGLDGIKYRLNDLYNAKAGKIKQTESGGLDINKIKEINVNNGDHIDDVKALSRLGYNLAGLDKDSIELLDDIIQSNDNLSNKFRIDQKHKKLFVNDANNEMLQSAEGRKEIFNDLINAVAQETQYAERNLGDGQIHRSIRKIPSIEFYQGKHGKSDGFSIRVDAKNGIAPEMLDKLLSSKVFRKNFDVISRPDQMRDGNYMNGVLRFVPKDKDFNSVTTNNNLERLNRSLENYIDDRRFEQHTQGYVDIGTDPELIDILRQKGFNNIINGRLYSPGQNENERLDEASKIVQGYKQSHINSLNRFGNATTSYILNGNHHGLDEVQKTLSNYTTKRFKSINSPHTDMTLKGLNNLSGKMINMQAHQIQDEINNVLLDNYNGSYGLAQAYQREAQRLNLKLSDKSKSIINEMSTIVKSAGTNDPRLMNENARLAMKNRLNDLTKDLESNSQLNTLQTNILSSTNDDRIKDISNKRNQLLHESGLTPRQSMEAFKDMTPSQIGEYSSIMNTMKDVKIDNHGIFSAKVDSRVANDPRLNQRISAMLRTING